MLDQSDARRFLNRTSWLTVCILSTMALSYWLEHSFVRHGRATTAQAFDVAFVVEAIALTALLFVFRRRLIREVETVAGNQHVIVGQNEELASQNGDLEQQRTTLAQQAGQLQEAGDKSARLAHRLAEAQRVARLGYWEIDPESARVFWSEEAYRIMGLEPTDEPQPIGWLIERVHPEDRARVAEVPEQARQLKELSEQYRLILPDKSVRTIQLVGRRTINEQGRIQLVGTIQDVTERVRLETQLRHAQRMEAVGQLAGGVAHDFNNLLTVISGYAGLMRSEAALSPTTQEYVQEIDAAAQRAAHLTRQLLAFGRQQLLRPQVLDLNDIITDTSKMLRRLIPSDIVLHTTSASTLERVLADPGQIERVLVNLVVNARDAMPSGGTVTIETSNIALGPDYTCQYPHVSPGHYVLLAISDTGTGIPTSLIEHIFEPFVTTKESGKGTGLGLSTVHGIVLQSGGHITVYSEIDHGTTFKVYLPAVADDKGEAKPVLPEATPVGGHERILLVEDDAAVRAVAKAILGRGGYTVIEAANGRDALRIIETGEIEVDLVLSDMVMPQMGGKALHDALRLLRPTLPIILMSGYTRDAMLRSDILPPRTRFIEKPFSIATISEGIRALMGDHPV